MTGLMLVFLALVALIGLLTGVLAHTLISPRAMAAHTTTPGATATAARIATATATLTTAVVTGNATPPSSISSQFQLSVTVAPRSVAAGQQVTISVNAFTPDTHQPIAGLPCQLRAPTDGSLPLLASWPATQTTNAQGIVVWTITTPSATPAGSYGVEAFAQTATWSFHADSAVAVRAA